MTTFVSHSPQQTRQIGQFLGTLLAKGDVICLDGDLSAGKTTFSIGVGEGWGAESPMTSPTFVIVHQYRREKDKQVLYHLDAYRLESEGDAESIGLYDILDSNGAVLIEWPEKIQHFLPPENLWITFTLGENDDMHRNLTFRAEGRRPLALLHAIQAEFGK